MTLLPDCELHLSIHVRLHALNDTHFPSTILYYIISNRCHLRFWMFYYFVCYFHVLHIFIVLLFYFCWNLAVFITCYWNNKLTYLLTSSYRKMTLSPKTNTTFAPSYSLHTMHLMYFSIVFVILSSFLHRSCSSLSSPFHRPHPTPHRTSTFCHLTHTPSAVCLLLPRSRILIFRSPFR